MNLTGVSSIKGYVFDGAYSELIRPIDPTISPALFAHNINPTGVTGIFVYYNTGNSTDSGYLPIGVGKFANVVLSGASNSSSDYSGYIYYNISAPIYGVCHGFGRDEDAWHKGYNFYNAFHPQGYISPPFGESLTVVKENHDGRSALAENGGCSTLTVNEYNDLFGIVSKSDPSIGASSEDVKINAESFINSPSISCPQDLSVTFYWHETQYKLIAGTAGAISANGFYNNNPIPTALDNYDAKTSLRYKTTHKSLTPPSFTDNGDGTRSERIEHTIVYNPEDGKPMPEYLTVGGNDILNTQLCPLHPFETSVSYGKNKASLLVDTPDDLSYVQTSHFDSFNMWNIWHFLFKENSDGFPFTNDFNNQGDNYGLQKTAASANFGSQLFEADLSMEDNYWERRQCPKGIDFLPHTFGASIYACPSYYFEVPYYAALKKFGFYGTRFFNGCVSLSLTYPASGDVTKPDSVEIDTGVKYITPDDSEPDEDGGINWSFGAYDNLLRIAKAEESNSDFYALNKMLFLWANKSLVSSSSEYNYLSNNYGSKFTSLFNNLFNEIDQTFPHGKSDLLNTNAVFESGAASIIYDTSSPYAILSDTRRYANFYEELVKTINAQDKYYWNEIEKIYGMMILDSPYVIDDSFYSSLTSQKRSRFLTRYLENYVKGNPVDLYPSNKIVFGLDTASGFINSNSWGKSSYGYNSSLKYLDNKLSRRFFVGAYGNGEDVVGYVDYIGLNKDVIRNSSFYPGYFNSNLGISIPKPAWSPVLTGTVASNGENVSYNSILGENNSLPDGWLGMGYHGVGKLQGNFSCFTPIFTKSPMARTFCKIGQSPVFRAEAVDYHTIPEDKINIRYPEIVYWTKKLKLVDSSYKNRYPLSYKWYRIKTGDCSDGDFKNFLISPDFSKVEPASLTGTWGCLEGDDKNCTLIHPQECIPVFDGSTQWPSKYSNTPMQEDAKRNNYYMAHKQGAKYGNDDLYYYFCMVRGRFGVRISEPSLLSIEDWIKFDVSAQNGGNVPLSPHIAFEGKDKNGANISVAINGLDISTEYPDPLQNISPYNGFVIDKDFIPENVLEKQIPPPNAGFGDVYSYKFVGTWGYRGASQSYSPGTLNETRGLKETWERIVHYGSFLSYGKKLSQVEGDFLYGKNHLPVCSAITHRMGNNDGVRVAMKGVKVVHWANMQEGVIDTKGNYGVKWDKLGNAGELYNAAGWISYAAIDKSHSPGLGQWQYGNNLGTVHMCGYFGGTMNISPYPLSTEDEQKLKTKLFGNGTLGGSNCGWHKYGLGRNMLYWIEGFSTFYAYCDPVKKKNITDYNYMNPGLRQSNSSIQYFWLGKPSNSYLERYPMFGPYAYQWRVKRHNRDRNGNGMSEGFYSYGWGDNYSYMYDGPAIYGLFLKQKESNKDIDGMNKARTSIFGSSLDSLNSVKRTRFGFTNGNGGAKIYGDIYVGLLTGTPNTVFKDYVLSGQDMASNPELSLYGCDDASLNGGYCFDPCLSIRYPNGFFPGGKKQDLAMANGSYRLVPDNLIGGKDSEETVLDSNKVAIRGPFGTPHYKFLKYMGYTGVHGMSPCADGGSDHCNYITPTINIGASMYLEGSSPQALITSIASSTIANLSYPPLGS